MPISNRNICCLPSQKTLLAENSTGGFCHCCYKKKLKSTPQKNGPVLSGYNQSSTPFKRREPKSSFLNSWPFLPKPEGYISPQQRCNAAQLELANQSLALVNVYYYWLKTQNYRREVYLGSSPGKGLQLPMVRPCQCSRTWELRNPEEKLDS